MALEKMSILIDSDLKKDFINCVLRHYDNAEEGILEIHLLLKQRSRQKYVRQFLKATKAAVLTAEKLRKSCSIRLMKRLKPIV